MPSRIDIHREEKLESPGMYHTWIEEGIGLSKEECKALYAQFKSYTINQNEEPGTSAYPVMKAILDFANE
jgi:hypothetical protein